MRTTLDIDDDILAAARDLAKAEGKTMGAVMSDLARRALTAPTLHPPGLAEGQLAYGDELWVTFPKREGVIVTPDHIRRVQDEIDEEDTRRAADLARGKQSE